MARQESKMIMGYLPIEPKHHAAILSLVAPATPETRLLDPYAGEGQFLEAAAKAWNVTPYANELDGERAAKCIERFGPTQAVRCDVERLVASNEAFGILWANPPYDHDAVAKDNKRIEFAYLRHAWKWAQDGGIVLWAIYNQHITEAAAAFLSTHSTQVDVWALPGKHQGEYDQVVVVALKGTPASAEKLYAKIMAEKVNPRLLTVQPTPLYQVPHPPDPTRRFTFAPDMIDEEQGLRLVQSSGAWRTNGFQALLETPTPPAMIEPVVAPRPGHLALVLAAGVADGAIIETEAHGRVAIRGKTVHVEEIARVEVEVSPDDPDKQVTKTTTRLKPTTTLTLLSDSGERIQMAGDEALLDFIVQNKKALVSYLNRKFKPMYQFDYNGLRPWLKNIRLKGKHPLYTAQQHVVGAITRGFKERKGILLVGSMGTGKTAMGGSVAVAMTAIFQQAIPAGKVVLIVAPPHLIDKWERELCSLDTRVFVERIEGKGDVKAFESLKAFMDRTSHMDDRIAKIGLIKRDTTKLGTPLEPAVIWKKQYKTLWPRGQVTPKDFTPEQRIQTVKYPICPHCGIPVLQGGKKSDRPATDAWLRAGKRTCEHCFTPLWQEAREDSSKPAAGEKYPRRNPRYRLDQYLKRQYPDRVHLLIWDECHEAQHGDTGNGEAFQRIASVSDKVLAMTGTPFNGRASSLFNLEYALNPRVRERYPWGGAQRLTRKQHGSKSIRRGITGGGSQRGEAESRWVADMGVREQITEERPTYDHSTGAYTGTSTYERPYEEAPGISPLLVAEILDHAVYFSLQDLGKALPTYEEIAVGVPMDSDTGAVYESTRNTLKQYLTSRRWEGDTSFRGAYLQWAMGWPDTAFRPMKVIHNLKHPITGEKKAFTVVTLPAFGEQRIYRKEQKLLDLVSEELAANRPLVIFVRQTDTQDIQPRLLDLIQKHVPLAKPFILRNTVIPDRRERVINQEVAKGMNVMIANPELCKTGLDLVFAPTLVFYEMTFNLATMMQAAGRSLRLNQTAKACKTYYLYYEGTMEETAVQLMSRKQRAAKILNGDIGLTGLDALTEGEAGLQEALMAAIGQEADLIDPAQLFKASGQPTELDAEDAAYWNSEPETVGVELPSSVVDPMLVLALPAPIPEPPTREPAAQSELSNTLKLLAEKLGPATIQTEGKRDPFALTPPAQSTPKKPTVPRRRKPGLMDVPTTSPALLPMIIPPTSYIGSGVQVALF